VARRSHPANKGTEASPDGALGKSVMIVDDHSLFAEAIRATLEERGMRFLGAVTNGREGIALASREQPDVALVDLGLPDAYGVNVGKTILEESPGTKVLAVTALNDSQAVKEALRAGFHGYLTKDTPLSSFVDSIIAALGGQVVVQQRPAGAAGGKRTEEEESAALRADHLTAREREVLSLLVQGMSGNEIATRLSVSANTVRTHVQNILSKLQVHSRLEAATFAVRYGIVRSPQDHGS
jgi:two-component system nitrate/nitrite response regulator NarL